MLPVINVLLPIFGLIFAGWLCRRTHRLGATAASEINRFVVWLALPALLFRLTSTAEGGALWHGGFVLVFAGSMLLLFVGTLLWRWRAGESLADASLAGLCAGYANTGYVGLPLCLLVLGDAGMAPALISCLLVVCGLFGLALVCIEMARHAEQGLLRALGKVLWSLARNPLVLAPLLGALWGQTGIATPQALALFLQLLGDATVPCALVSLGLFLAQPQPKAPVGKGDGSLTLVLLKLLGQPLLVLLLCWWVELPPLWSQAALLLAALPTGTGPFMLAEYYQCAAQRASRVILWSTLGSLVTLSGLLLWMPQVR